MGVAAADVPTKPTPPKRSVHIFWAALIAHIYEVLPLLCPICAGQVRIIGFITYSADIRHILDHIGVQSEAPAIAAARGPPLWEDCGAQDCQVTQLGPALGWLRALKLNRPGALGTPKLVPYWNRCGGISYPFNRKC